MPYLQVQKPQTDGDSHEMTRRKPGRPRRNGPTKVPITIRLDTDVLNALKLTGPGWQTRVNGVVRNWILNDDEESFRHHDDVNDPPVS